MPTLSNVAGYGLVPMPASFSKGQPWDDEPPTAEESNAALHAWHRHVAAERKATGEEIARLRQQLEAATAGQESSREGSTFWLPYS
jgi:hypothetical protein